MQHGMFRDACLNEYHGASRIDSCGQPVDQQLTHVLSDAACVCVVCRERVPICDKKITFMLVLKLLPILKRSKVIAQMQEAAGLHAAQHPLLRLARHGDTLENNPTAVERIVPERPEANVLVKVWMIRSSRSNTRSPTRIIIP